MLDAGERWRLIEGDCRAMLPELLAAGVSAVVTDPPYGMACNTDSTRFSGGNRLNHRRHGDGRNDWPTVAGDDEPFDPAPWLAFPRVVLWGYHHFAQRLPVGTVFVWLKKADANFGSFLSDAELAWMKGGHGVYAYRKQFPPSSRMAEGEGRCLHPMQKPVELMAWCLRRAKVPEGGIVLDPYCGSGTTGEACLQLGYRFIGVEIDPTYAAAARRRLGDPSALPDPGGLFAGLGVDP